MKLVITGGHHSSAVPLIHRIQRDYPNWELYWAGHIHSLKNDRNTTLEYREITSLGIPFFELKAGKVYRTFSPENIVKIPKSIIESYLFLKKVKPDLVISFGGYIAAPIVIAAWVLRIPSITHEQTVAAGYANKVIAFFVKKILISWKQSEAFYPPSKLVFTGLPLRESIFEVKPGFFETDNHLPYIFVIAGKSGSTKINKVIESTLPQLLMFANVIHQCGDYSEANDYVRLQSVYEKIQNALTGKYFLKKFIFENEVGSAYAKARLVVGRSGAHTVGEILALEKPALLIPIPWVSHNEQFKNAEMVKQEGLAEILKEADLRPEIFVEKVRYILHNLHTYRLSGAVSYKHLGLNARELILKEILKFVPNEK